MENFIGISRNIENHWIYKDAEFFKVWFDILLRARYTKEPAKEMIEGKLVTLEYGQFIYGRVSWSERLKVSERRLRTLFDRLVQDDMVRLIAKYPKFTVYSVTNYGKYNTPDASQNLAEISPKLAEISPEIDQRSDQQNDQRSGQQKTLMGQGNSGLYDQHNDNQNDQHNDHQTTSKRPSNDQQATTKEERKERNNVLKDKELKDIVPYSDITNYLNLKTGKNFRVSKESQKHINARWADGFRLEQFYAVIDKKTAEWLDDPEMDKYLRPQTLFGTKFESYLNQKTVIRDRRNQDEKHWGSKVRYERNTPTEQTPSISDDEMDAIIEASKQLLI